MFHRIFILIQIICVAGFFFAPASSVFSYSIEDLHTDIALEKDGAYIRIYHPGDLQKATLFWNHQKTLPDRRISQYSEYPYRVESRIKDARRYFFLPYGKDNEGIPFNQTIRFRIESITSNDQAPRVLRTREYRFRVLERESGDYYFGLMFSSGPVVEKILGEKATISWETNQPCSAEIQMRRKNSSKTNIIKAGEDQRVFSITLDQLGRGLTYHYRIKCRAAESGDQLASHEYRFRSEPESGDSFKFAVMGDSRGNSEALWRDYSINGVNTDLLYRFMKSAYSHNVDFMIFTGDMIKGYTTDAGSIYLRYRTWVDAVAPFRSSIPVYPVMGDHDAFSPPPAEKQDSDTPSSHELWRRLFHLPENGPSADDNDPTYKENVYSFNFAGCHFCALNSAYYKDGDNEQSPRFSTTIDAKQRDWLQLDMEENKSARFHFVTFHEPLYPVSAGFGRSVDRHPKVRNTLALILENYRVDALFTGRENNYSVVQVDSGINQRVKNPFLQINSGGAGPSLNDVNRKIPWISGLKSFSDNHHWILVEVRKKQCEFTVFDVNGIVIDRFIMDRKQKLKE